MRFLFTFLLLFFYLTSFSCLNNYYPLDSKGKVHWMDMGDLRVNFNQTFDKKEIESQLNDLSFEFKSKKIETDPDVLLSYASIKQETSEDKNVDDKKSVPAKAKDFKPVKKTDNSMLWIGLTLVVLIISIFTYFKSKRK